MTWIRRSESVAPHVCPTPEVIKDLTIPETDGESDDLWRCDECRTLWRVKWKRWMRAGWWLRMRHHGDGYPPRPPYDVVNDDGSITHYSSEAEQNAGRAAVVTLPVPVAVPPDPPPPADFRD